MLAGSAVRAAEPAAAAPVSAPTTRFQQPEETSPAPAGSQASNELTTSSADAPEVETPAAATPAIEPVVLSTAETEASGECYIESLPLMLLRFA